MAESADENPLVTLRSSVEVSNHEGGDVVERQKAKKEEDAPNGGLRPKRAEIDTAAPFESVKKAVTLFGKRADWKGHSRTGSLDLDRRAISEEDALLKAQGLAHAKEQLTVVEASTEEALAELERVKMLIAQTMEEEKDEKPTDIVVLCDEAETEDLLSAKKKQEEASAELKGVKDEIGLVKGKLGLLLDAKKDATKRVEEAVSALKQATERCEELSKELSLLNRDLTVTQAAHEVVEKEIASLQVETLGANSAMEKMATPVENPEDVTDIEYKLVEESCLVEKLKKEIAEVQESQRKASLAVSETECDLEKVNLELSQAKEAEMKASSDLGSVRVELDQVKEKMLIITNDLAPLSASTESLRIELAKEKSELELMHEKEQTACAWLASLQEELVQLREELARARAGEAMAKESLETLPTAIKQLALQADEAKTAMEAAKEEARRARHEAEDVKATTIMAESRLQVALKEAEAARASEAMAIAEYNTLTESDSEPERGAGPTLSLEEYTLLNKKAKEAEEVASSRVAAALQQVESAKSSQNVAQERLVVATEELKACKKMMQEALKKADDAQASKLAAEGELRKWRAEHEVSRKSGNLRLGSLSPNSAKEFLNLPAEEIKLIPVDSASQVMSLKVPQNAPAPDSPDSKLPPAAETAKEKVRKKALLARMAAYLTKKSKKKTVK